MLQINISGEHAEDVSTTVSEVVAKMLREGHSVLGGDVATYEAFLTYRQPSGKQTDKGNEIMDVIVEPYPIKAGEVLYLALQHHDHAPTILITSKIAAE